MVSLEQLREKTIFIIDHDDDRCAVLQKILSESGFRNLICASGHKEVFELIRPFQGRIDELGVILIDHDLPHCDSLELCSLLSTLDGHDGIPVIYMTHSGNTVDPDFIQQCQASQVAAVIEYPQTPEQLIPLVNVALALKNERDERLSNQEKLVNELAERRIMEARLQYLVAHDELTGLSNRSGLEKALDLGILRCNNFKQPGALLDLDLDLDQFKVINDIEGHETGDHLLVEMASLIRAELDKEAFIARVGSNLFQIFLSKITEKEALETAETLRVLVEDYEFATNNNTYNVSASIGVALLTPKESIRRPSELMSKAHQACYMAKNLGRNRVCLFSKDDLKVKALREDARWVPLLRRALVEDRFKLVFQPVVRAKDGKLSHYETLLRMVSEQGTLLSPNQFIPVAERMGLIHQIDLWVVTHAIDFIANLPSEHGDVHFTINLSSHALQGDYLLPALKKKLEMTWVAPSRITFEITETAAVANVEKTRQMVSRIRALGCRFALDDFGAGFSTFNYVKNFPVDYLKIDGQFITNLVCDTADQVLVRSMIEVAHSLGKKTIAEYVSTPEILRLLKEFGVDYVQGFLLGKPQPELLPEKQIVLNDLMDRPFDISRLIPH